MKKPEEYFSAGVAAAMNIAVIERTLNTALDRINEQEPRMAEDRIREALETLKILELQLVRMGH